MVQGKKTFNNSKPKFAEVVIGDSEVRRKRCVLRRIVAPPAVLI